MITSSILKEASNKFDEIEIRGSYYPLFLKLIDHDFKTEAYLLIMATWNTSSFRYAKFELTKFTKTLDEINKLYNDFFNEIENERFKTIEFNDYEEEIIDIFERLKNIPGVYYTGTSKIMHLMNRNVFVMWDRYISGNITHAKERYKKLEIVQRNERIFKKYENCGEGYLQFLNDMKDLFRPVDFQHPTKTFAKMIDEYNYVNITIPIQDMERREKNEKKKMKAKLKK